MAVLFAFVLNSFLIKSSYYFITVFILYFHILLAWISAEDVVSPDGQLL